MNAISHTTVRERLGELLDRVEAGESFDITRRGRAVARLCGAPASRKRIDAASLHSLTAAQTFDEEGASALIRRVRDADRY